MVLTVDVSGILDGEGMLDIDRALAAAWSEKYERDGWTRTEWMRRSHTEHEVRRMPEGTWQARLTHRERIKAVVLAGQALESKSWAMGAEEEFDRLVGIPWSDWVAGKREARPGHVDRPWTSIPDEWWPSIETAYQRYIHHG